MPLWMSILPPLVAILMALVLKDILLLGILILLSMEILNELTWHVKAVKQ